MLRNGQQKTLKAPLNIAHSMTGMDPCPNLSLDEIKLHNLQQIKLNDNGTMELQTAHASLTLLPGNTTLSGTGASSQETIKLTEIENIQFEGGLADERLQGPHVWDFMLACGQKIRMGFNLDNLLLYGSWGSFDLRLGLSTFTNVLRANRSPGSLDFLAANGKGLSGVKPEDDEYLTGDTVFGTFLMHWDNINSANVVKELSQPAVLPPPTDEPTWIIQNGKDFSLLGADLNLAGAYTQDKLTLNVIPANLDSLKVNDKGGLILVSSSLSYEVREGYLSGRLVDFGGTFTIPIAEISGLSTRSALSGGSTRPTPAPPEGKLLLPSGSTLEVSGLQFKDGEPKYGDQADPLHIKTSLRVLIDTLEYWVSWDWLISQGFKQDGFLISLPCLENDFCLTGMIRPEARLAFQSGPFNMNMAFSDARSYIPLAEPAKQAPFSRPYSLTITNTNDKEVQIHLGDLSYARFPKTAWSGLYHSYDWPFQWYTMQGLLISRGSNHPLIPFASLVRIEFPDGCTSPDCTVKLTGTDGSITIDQLFPGPDNKETRSGPSTWSTEEEGLLGSLDQGILVFIPFAQIRSIELKSVPNP
jgi:hypothetical protein